MKLPKSTNEPDRIKKVKDFLNDCTHDYIAARVLFLSALPKQAAVLSSTAIEKCFKAVLAFNGNESHGHLKNSHWNAVENFDRNLFNSLNQEFLELNKKVYRLRYTDDLPIDFNLVVATREFLAELDQTVLSICRLFQIGKRDESYRPTMLEHLISSQDQRIHSENHILSKESKETFINSKPQFIYEIRKISDDFIFETQYWSECKSNNECFLRSGFTPKPDGRSYDLSFLPLQN